jgi:5-methylcytosine-specific restriction endonuclease McrA
MQLKKNKVKKQSKFCKKKSFIKKKSVKKILTKEEREYLLWLQTREHTVCFVCGKRNLSDDIEWHHVKERSSDKKNHFRLIPLCGSKHHRHGELSPHANPSRWRETFSMELQLKYAAGIYEEYLNTKF